MPREPWQIVDGLWFMPPYVDSSGGVVAGAFALFAPFATQDVHIVARLGIGWDADLPLRPWPAFRRAPDDACAAFCGVFLGVGWRQVACTRDVPDAE